MAEAHPAERVRQRLERFMEISGYTQREFAAALGMSQPWLEKILTGENQVRLEDLDNLADKMHTTAAQLIRTDEERYTLELTPTELNVVERLRRKPELLLACLTLLQAAPASSVGSRRASPKGPRHGTDPEAPGVEALTPPVIASLADIHRALGDVLSAQPRGHAAPSRPAVARARPRGRRDRAPHAPKDKPA